VKPNVVLLTRDSLYSRTFLESFIKHADVNIVGVALSTNYLLRGKNPLVDLTCFIRRVGLGYTLYQLWVGHILPLFSSQPDFSSFCKPQGTPLLKTIDINGPSSLAWLRSLQADFILSFHFNQKLLATTLTVPRIAAINFHPAYLPSLGGVDPVFFHLASGDGELGASVHLVTDNLDAGDILAQSRDTERPAGLIATNLHLFEQGGLLAATVLKNFAGHNHERRSQKEESRTYFGWKNIRESGFWRTLFRRLK